MAEEDVKVEKKGGGKGLIIALIVIVLLLVIGIGVLAYLLLGNSGDGSSSSEGVSTAEHSEASANNPYAKTYSAKFKQYEPPGEEAIPLYFIMDKFVVNFNGDGQARFLAVDLQFLSYYPQLVGPEGDMEHLRPILKNDIQRLLRNQHFNDLNLPEGPDNLRAEILKVVRAVLEKHNIYPDLIEDVYMTRFVMQ